MPICRNATLPKCLFAKMPIFQNAICQNANLPKYIFAKMLFAEMPFCQSDNWPNCLLTKMVFGQNAYQPKCLTVKMPICQNTYQPKCLLAKWFSTKRRQTKFLFFKGERKKVWIFRFKRVLYRSSTCVVVIALKFLNLDSSGRRAVRHRDKTRVQMPARIFPHLTLKF